MVAGPTPQDRDLHLAPSGPTVMLVAGINGAGKTTSIAKLAWLAKNELNKKVMVVRQRHVSRCRGRSAYDLGGAAGRGDREAQDGRGPGGRRVRRLRGGQVARASIC